MSFRQRLEHGDALGADRQAVGGVLDVAAGDDDAVRGLERGADLETREVGDGVLARRARGRDERSQRRSDVALNDFLQQRDELAAHPSRRFHHLVVIERLRQHAGRHVRDARDAEHLDAHVARGNRLRHGGHADRVGADRPQIADFGGRLVARAEQRRRRRRAAASDPAAFAGLVGDAAAAARVDLGHVGKARAEAIVVRRRPADCCRSD